MNPHVNFWSKEQKNHKLEEIKKRIEELKK